MTSPISASVSKKLSLFSFVATVLVVLIHTPTSANAGVVTYIEMFLSDRLAWIAVPFFFAASGYLLAGHIDEPNWWKAVSGKRMRTILVPYLFWCAIYAIVYLVDAFVRSKPFGWMDVVNGFGINPMNAPFSPLWYLRELLLLLLPLPLFVAVLRLKRWIGCVFLIALFVGWQFTLCCVDAHPALEMGLLYFVSFRALLFFCAGIWLRIYPVHVNRLLAGMTLVVGLALFVLERRLGCGIALLRHSIDSLAVVLSLIGAWVLLPPLKLPKMLAGMAFPIYLIHRIFIMSYELFADFRAPQLKHGLLAYLFIAIGAVALSVAVGRVMIARIPKLASIAFGGRGK